MMDEARFGLHTEMRRVWTLRGRRPVVARQIKYEWDYLYGALSVIGGEAHFAHLPGVSWSGMRPTCATSRRAMPGPSTSSSRTKPGSICATETRG